MSIPRLGRRAVGPLVLLGLVLGSAALALFPSSGALGADSLAPDSLAKDPVARGKYLVSVFACSDCHTPKRPDGKPDMAFYMAGHRESDPVPTWSDTSWDEGVGMAVATTGTAYAGPWGRTYARNLTPDRVTGIGGWNDEAFINVLREGTLKPPMPATAYGQLSDEDLSAMFAYLQSLPPVKNLVPFRELAPPRLPGEVPGTKGKTAR
jgi:mono/diheme cytochrome c family protein